VLIWLGRVVLVGLVLLGVSSLPRNPWSPWRLIDRAGSTDQLRQFASQVRLERLERALQVCYLDTGAFPEALSTLARHGYVSSADLLDPWSRDYDFQLSAGGYRLAGGDAEGRPSPELTVTRSFNEVQRQMLFEQPPAAPP
jgi:hypothetical protein